MPGGSTHGREPEPLEEVLDCLAYVRAVRADNEDSALAALDVLHLRFAGRHDAIVAPLRLACLIVEEAERQGCDAAALLAGVRERALAEHDRRHP